MEASGSSEMLQVAEEAERAGDYGLAAEIYGSQLSELPKPERSLCLRRAEALARAGKVSESLDSYSLLATVGELLPEDLKLLVECVARNLRVKQLAKLGQDVSGEEGLPLLLCCPCCHRLLLEPVTLTCGHSLCRGCLQPEMIKTVDLNHCPFCGPQSGPGCTRVNVVLGSLLKKTFPKQSQSRSLCEEASCLHQSRDLQLALQKYSEALELDPSDYQLVVQRAEVYIALKSYKQALADAEAVCCNKPLCAKGHAAKAKALSGLGRRDEALKEYMYCVALNPEMCEMKSEAQKIMCEMFTPAFENVHGNLAASFSTPSSFSRLKTPFLSSGHTSPPSEGPFGAGTSKDSMYQLAKTGCQKSNIILSADFSKPSHNASDIQTETRIKTLEAVLSALPEVNLKRSLSCNSEDLETLEMPCKMMKKGVS